MRVKRSPGPQPTPRSIRSPSRLRRDRRRDGRAWSNRSDRRRRSVKGRRRDRDSHARERPADRWSNASAGACAARPRPPGIAGRRRTLRRPAHQRRGRGDVRASAARRQSRHDKLRGGESDESRSRPTSLPPTSRRRRLAVRPTHRTATSTQPGRMPLFASTRRTRRLRRITIRWNPTRRSRRGRRTISCTLSDSTQGGFIVQEKLARLFGLREENVRVISPFLGGGFGGKGVPWSHVVLAAMAARVTKPRSSSCCKDADVPFRGSSSAYDSAGLSWR